MPARELRSARYGLRSRLSAMGIDLVVVAEEHKHVLANLLQFYRYDFSVIRGYELTPHGTFIYCYLDSYFTEDGREACFITADGQLAGFTMTRRMEDGAREVAEFFVARRYRRHGVGRAAARQMFLRHPGKWLLAFDHDNSEAAGFWPFVAAAVADGPVGSSDRFPPEVSYPGTWLRFAVRAGGGLVPAGPAG
jgi:predicted acetyltransferase